MFVTFVQKNLGKLFQRLAASVKHLVPLTSCLVLLLSAQMFWSPAVRAEDTVIHVRKDISTFTESEYNSLKRGIRVMEERSKVNPEDPTGWLYQANIHGCPYDTGVCQGEHDSGPIASCQHGSFFFLPWHRAYLYYFERILREASGDENLALPYWNYEKKDQRTIPEPYRSPDVMCESWQENEKCNPLYANNSHRNLFYNRLDNPQELPNDVVSTEPAFSYTNFASPQGSADSFGGQELPEPTHYGSPHGQLEQKPHDKVHNAIGSNVDSAANTCDGTWMADADCAARDPIFWIHHANIDRLWENWLALDDGRKNPTDNSNWMETSFTFYNENKELETIAVSEVLNTEDLGYVYGDDPLLEPKTVAATYANLMETTSAPRGVDLGGLKKKVSVPFGPLTTTQLFIASMGRQSSPSPTLTLEGIHYQPGAPIYRVYLNLPDGVEENAESPYFVGHIALFAYPQGTTLKFDLSDEIASLVAREDIPENATEISVSFVPIDEREVKALVEAGASVAGIHVDSVKLSFE